MKKEFKKLIKENKFSEVFKMLENHFKQDEKLYDQLILLEGRYKTLKGLISNGEITTEKATTQENAIRSHLLDFVTNHCLETEAETNADPSQINYPSGSSGNSMNTPKGADSQPGIEEQPAPDRTVEAKPPYKFLNYYDIEDADCFFGRTALINTAYEELEERFNSKISKNLICIIGHSGAGKSSFLRAGVLARFKQEQNQFVVIFRPSDLRAINDEVFDPILGILDCVEEQIKEIKITARMRASIKRCRGSNKIDALFKCLSNCLTSAFPDHQKVRLLFGIDQFEWIIDYLVDPKSPRQWNMMLDFVKTFGESEVFGVAYTLETSRKHQLLNWLGDQPSVFKEDQYEMEVDGYHSEFIYNIIKCPFEKEGYVLPRERIKKLMIQIKNLISPGDICTVHSLLPIIAYRLSKLFDHVKSKLPEPNPNNDLKQASSNIFRGQGPSPSLESLFDEVEERLGFEALIEELAEENAWKEGYLGNPENVADQVEYFLHPLVGLAGSNDATPRLKTMQWPTYKDERQLIESFERNRLIVRMPDGQLRLLNHQIIRWWKRAHAWYFNDAQQSILKKEVIYLRKAEKWVDQGRPDPALVKNRAEQIDDAVEILTGYLRYWAIGDQNKDNLGNENKLLAEYCIALLRQSDTPDRIVKYKGYESSHIHRAAQYGLLDLIKRFCEQDRRYLKKKFFKKERTLLHEAAWSHRDLVQYLLDAGANPNVPDKQGWPPIAAAITMGRKEIFDLLCKKTTRKGLNGPFGSTMLHYCSSSGQKDMAKFLIEKYRLRPDQKDNNNFIPLQYAASNGHEEVFKFLAASSEIGVKDKWGRTVLHFAAEKGHTNLVQYLLKNDDLEESFFNAEDTDGNTAFHYAVVNHHADVVHVLLEVCDPNQKNRKLDTPLHLVIKEDSLAVNRVSLDRQINTVKMLLNDYRIDPNLLNTQGQTPLGKANQIREIQELLLNHPRFDPMALNGKKPQIVDCIRGKYWDALKHLSTKVKGALDAHKNTLLHLLFRENEVPDEILKDILAKFKTDINTLNENEWKQTQTPLQILLSKPKHQINWNLIVEILEAPELDLNNYKGNFYSVLTLLLFDLFDELNPVEDSIKENILTKMAKWNLSILLSQWDYCTWTPLHRLIVCQQTSAIRWLVAQGIDLAQVDHLDYFRRTPIDLATSSMQKEFALNERSSMPAKSWDSALSWTPVDSEKRVDLLSQVKLEDERYPIDERASFEWTELSFYQTKEIQLLRIYSEAWDNQLLKVYYLYTNEQLHRLKGESKPIHYVNALNLLKIDESTILDYLRFFCFFVRGVDGPFLIAEGTEQAEIKPLDLSSEDRQQLEQNLIPACFSFHDKQANQFFVTASVYYSNYIFYADFRIDAKTGMVEMLWDYPVRGFSKRIHQPIETNPSVTV